MATVLRGKTIKAGTDQASRPATFTFSDMASQGDDYVRRVRDEASKIVEQAKAEAAAIRKQALAEGQAAAESTISRLLDERVGGQLETLRPALDSVVDELKAARGEWLAHWRTAAVGLASAMAERIIRRELDNDPSVSEAWLTEALQLAAGSSDITVRLSPNDYEHLRGHAEALAETMGGISETRFVADPTVTTGGCRVETRHGSIDQQLETQLERLEEELN